MKLRTYLTESAESGNHFASRIGVPTHTVQRYLAGRVPRPDIVVAIYKATSGRVQPNDFYDLPTLPRRRKRAA